MLASDWLVDWFKPGMLVLGLGTARPGLTSTRRLYDNAVICVMTSRSWCLLTIRGPLSSDIFKIAQLKIGTNNGKVESLFG